MTHLLSLREFLDALEQIGDVQTIDTEVDWDLEMGAIIRRGLDLRAPAPLFARVKGIESGFRCLGAPGGLTADPEHPFARIALALGLPAQATGAELIDRLVQARDRPLIKPRVVDDGPSQQNVIVGDQVDLNRFPVPLIHENDGGRSLQTYGVNIVQSVDGTWTNWSVNRMMMLDGQRLACLMAPNQHVGMILQQWREKGEDMPIAVALGVEPGVPYVGGMPLPAGVSEVDYVGALFGEAVELVRAKTVPLDVPATAEIVIEGRVSITETAMEGPMGEYAGYLPVGEGTPNPVLNISAITYRDDPILPISAAGKPVEENHTGFGLPHSAESLYELRQAGLPVVGAWMVLESACSSLAVWVSQDWQRSGLTGRELATQIGDLIFASKAGVGVPKILLFEDDVDITDVREVVWAFATRAHPGHGVSTSVRRTRRTCPCFST